MNPRSNLKSEEKLDSLTGRDGKSRLGRREPLIKSYRLVSRASPFLPLKSPEPQIFAAKKPQTCLPSTLSYIVDLTLSLVRPFCTVARDIGAFLTTSVKSCHLISCSLLICFNYTTRVRARY